MASPIASKRSPKLIFLKALFDTYLPPFKKSLLWSVQSWLIVKWLLTFSIWTWYLSYFETLKMYVVYFNLGQGTAGKNIFKTGISSTDRFIWARTKIYLLLYFQVGVGFDFFVSGAQYLQWCQHVSWPVYSSFWCPEIVIQMLNGTKEKSLWISDQPKMVPMVPQF